MNKCTISIYLSIAVYIYYTVVELISFFSLIVCTVVFSISTYLPVWVYLFFYSLFPFVLFYLQKTLVKYSCYLSLSPSFICYISIIKSVFTLKIHLVCALKLSVCTLYVYRHGCVYCKLPNQKLHLIKRRTNEFLRSFYFQNNSINQIQDFFFFCFNEQINLIVSKKA